MIVFSDVLKQRFTFLLICIFVVFATDQAYRMLRPYWITYRHAEELYALKEWPQAAAAYEKAFSQGLNYPLAMLPLAHSYVKTRQFPEAIVWYTKYLTLKPNDNFVRRAYAGALVGNGDFDKAAAEYEKLLKQGPE
jgi:tetratricopeptide (TPR) repeat protein